MKLCCANKCFANKCVFTALAMFMAGFDIWVVNVAGPSLQRDLHVSDAACS